MNSTDPVEYVAENWSQLLKDESALLITVLVGLIYIGVILFTGIVSAVYACCCNSRKDKPDWDTRPVSYGWRGCSAIFATMISIGGVICIFANNYAHDAVGNVRGHLHETLMYPGAYFAVLHTQLESYYTEYQEFEETNMSRLKDRQLGNNIKVIHIQYFDFAYPLHSQDIVVDAFEPTQVKVDELIASARSLIGDLDNLKDEAGKTKTSASELETALNEYKDKGCNCNGIPECQQTCSMISFGITTIDLAYNNMDEALEAINASDFLNINGEVGDEFDQDCLIADH